MHWNGKILSDIASTKTVDVPKADDGSALKQACAVINTLNQWKVASCVKAMCFDTPPVNTGMIH